MKKIHALTLREDLLHSFEVKTSRGWIPSQRTERYRIWYKTIKGKKKGLFSHIVQEPLLNKRGQKQYDVFEVGGRIKRKLITKRVKKFRKFREIYLTSSRKFNKIRIDGRLIYNVGKPVKMFKLERLLTWQPLEKVNPILIYINRVRQWALSEDMNVGGFPLVPFVKIWRKNAKAKNPNEEMAETEIIEGYFKFQQDFIKEFGLGQVWKSDKESEEYHIYLAYWTQTGWREYRNEMPRFFVRKLIVDREDVGLEDLGVDPVSNKGRQLILDYVLGVNKIYQRDQGGNLLLAPLGIVGWGYGD